MKTEQDLIEWADQLIEQELKTKDNFRYTIDLTRFEKFNQEFVSALRKNAVIRGTETDLRRLINRNMVNAATFARLTNKWFDLSVTANQGDGVGIVHVTPEEHLYITLRWS